MCQAVQMNELDTKCYAVDTWRGDEHAGFYTDDIFQDVNDYNAKNFFAFSSLMRMTFDDALQYFSDGSIDLLHIDGMHSYEAVKHDFESWLPKLSSRGVVIMHDIAVRERSFGVWKFWEELKGRYASFEFYHSHGLGVLFVGEDSEKTLRADLVDDEIFTRNLFAFLGQVIGDSTDKNVRRECVLYLDNGSGFFEVNAIRKLSDLDHFCGNISESFDIADDIKRVRFDPASNFCVVKNLRCHSNKGALSYTTNGHKINGDELFLTIDPQIFITDSMEDVSWIKVDAHVYEMGSDVFMESVAELIDENLVLSEAKNRLLEDVHRANSEEKNRLLDDVRRANDELNRLRHEYDHIRDELESAHKKIDFYKNSVFWHMTKPLRAICNFLNSFLA
jgi:hypothetical protein